MTNDLEINLISAPVFICTKLEAFKDRGKGDYMLSHDMEDIIYLVDFREELVSEIEISKTEVKTYLAEEFKRYLDDERFVDALSGHVLPDEASQARVSMIVDRLGQIASLSN